MGSVLGSVVGSVVNTVAVAAAVAAVETVQTFMSPVVSHYLLLGNF